MYLISKGNVNRRKIQLAYEILELASDSFCPCHDKCLSFISAVETELHKTFMSKNTFSKE